MSLLHDWIFEAPVQRALREEALVQRLTALERLERMARIEELLDKIERYPDDQRPSADKD